MTVPASLPIFRSTLRLDASVLTPADMVQATVAAGDAALVHADRGTVANWEAVVKAAEAAGVTAYTGMEVAVAARGRAVVLPRSVAGLERLASWRRQHHSGQREVEVPWEALLEAGADCVLVSPPGRGVVAHAARFGGSVAARRALAALQESYGDNWRLARPAGAASIEERHSVAAAEQAGVAVLPWQCVGALADDHPRVLEVVAAMRERRAANYPVPDPAQRCPRVALAPQRSRAGVGLAWLQRRIPTPVRPVASPGVPRAATLPRDNAAMLNVLASRMVERVQRHVPPDAQSRYYARLEQELAEIAAHPVALDLLSIQAAVLAHAHAQDVRPVLRGSAVNRLALVSLTDFAGHVDPVRDNLLFARFLNPARASFDVDLDIRPQDRPVLEAALRSAYGEQDVLRMAALEEVNGVQVLRHLAPTSADARKWAAPFLDDAGDPLKKDAFVAAVESAPAPATRREATARRLATRVHGVAVGWRQHAPGYVIAPAEVRATLCLQAVSVNGQLVPCVAAPRGAGTSKGLNLTKIDILNSKDLACLSVLESLVTAHGGPAVREVPEDDAATFAALRQRAFREQIPQLRGGTASAITGRVAPTTLQEICHITALSRPGTRELEPIYLARRAAPTPPIHPLVAPITQDTHGGYLYQEQLMETVLALGGDVEAAEAVYRAMKGGGDEQVGGALRTIAGLAKTQGFSPEQQAALRAAVQQAAGYMFAKGHALQYGRHAYVHAYYRANYPRLTAGVAADGAVKADGRLMPPQRPGLNVALQETVEAETPARQLAAPQPAPPPAGPSAPKGSDLRSGRLHVDA